MFTHALSTLFLALYVSSVSGGSAVVVVAEPWKRYFFKNAALFTINYAISYGYYNTWQDRLSQLSGVMYLYVYYVLGALLQQTCK